MQTCGGILEPYHSGRKMHQFASFHYCRGRLESLDRRLDSLSSDSHGMGLKHHQNSESHSDGHIFTGSTVRPVAPQRGAL